MQPCNLDRLRTTNPIALPRCAKAVNGTSKKAWSAALMLIVHRSSQIGFGEGEPRG